MGKPPLKVTLAAMVTCTMVGCGTVQNLQSGECASYGGVAADLGVCQNIQEGKIGVEGWVPGEWVFLGAVYCCRIADIPFSAVADTLSLPWTLAKKNDHSGKPDLGKPSAQP
jgi:uncharacterized protein YceK